MSFDRGLSRGRDTSPSDSSMSRSNLSLRLPPLHRRDPEAHRSHPYPAPVIPGRSMHQLQLELEYDAEESDNDSDRPTVPGWPGALERHQVTQLDHTDDQTARQIHALCIFDEISVPPHEQPQSALIQALSRAPAQRRWGRWRWREQPVLAEVQVYEAVMVYERGVEQTNSQRCNRCRAGQGISPQCVVAIEGAQRGSGSGPCSNCIYDGIGPVCNASGRRTPLAGLEHGSELLGDPDRVVDHMAVLEMIASLKRPAGARRDHSLPVRAKRIEAAALHIARAAREWGEKMSKEHE